MPNWVDIKGYEGLYQINKIGQIKSMPKTVLGKDNKIYFYKEKLLKERCNKDGYIRTCLFKNKNAKHFCVHRLVWESFVGEIPQGKEINHIDGQRNNNNIANLELVTHKENIKHSINILRHKIGGKNPFKQKVKCVETGVVYISIRDAALKTGANAGTISFVINNRYRKDKNGKKYKAKTSNGFHWVKA